jgi:hypothetical protein
MLGDGGVLVCWASRSLSWRRDNKGVVTRRILPKVVCLRQLLVHGHFAYVLLLLLSCGRMRNECDVAWGLDVFLTYGPSKSCRTAVCTGVTCCGICKSRRGTARKRGYTRMHRHGLLMCQILVHAARLSNVRNLKARNKCCNVDL